MTKTEIIREFKKEKLAVRDKHNAVTNEEHYAKDLELKTLCEKYLSVYPELNDKDCSGIGLPARMLKHLKGVSYAS
jgi:hypothetical protein